MGGSSRRKKGELHELVPFVLEKGEEKGGGEPTVFSCRGKRQRAINSVTEGRVPGTGRIDDLLDMRESPWYQ